MIQFLLGERRPVYHLDGHYDPRYFYVEEDCGRYVCGFLRDFLIAILVTIFGFSEIITSNKSRIICELYDINNSYLRGYWIKKLCLCEIQQSGLEIDVGSLKIIIPEKAPVIFFNEKKS